MSKPWEKYASTNQTNVSAKPWEKYSKESNSADDQGPSVFTSAVRKLSQGATGGLSDEFAGGVEAAGRVFGLKGAGGPLSDISLQKPTLDSEELKAAYRTGRDLERENLKQDSSFNPATSITAEIAGGIASPVNKLTKGMSIAKQGATMGGLYGFGSSEADNAKDLVLDTAKGSTIGLVTGKAFDKAGQLIAPKISETSSKIASKISEAVPKQAKDKIIAAADRVGLKLTPAMLDDTGFVERLEYTLSNSPSFLGQKVNRSQKEAYASLQSAVKEAVKDATNLTEDQVGNRVKSGINAKIAERLDPISSVFDTVRDSTKHIPISQKSKDAIIRNIQNTDEYVLTGGSGKASQYVEMLNRVRNADQVKTMMSMLNSDIGASQGAERQVLMTIRNKLGNLEENSITRAAIVQSKEAGMKNATGKNIASEVIGELKDARRGYRDLMTDISDTSLDARLGKTYGVKGFLDKIENIPNEKIQTRFFNSDNQRQLSNLAKNFPEEFELLRQGKLRDISEAAVGSQGETSVAKFLNQVDKLSPEAKAIVFRGNSQLIDDVLTLNNALPRNFNPSGSGTQKSWSSPWEWAASNVSDVGKYALYKGASTNLGRKIGKALDDGFIDSARDVTGSSIKKLTNPTTRMSSSSAATKELKGFEKWAVDGEENLRSAGLDSQTIEKMKKDKKGRQILIEASAAKPDSKMMKSVLSKVRTGYLQEEGE